MRNTDYITPIRLFGIVSATFNPQFYLVEVLELRFK